MIRNNRKSFGYVRVSTKKQVENGKSIENQITKIKKYFEIHDIFDYEIIVDDGYSAGSDDRPGYKRLIRLIKSKKVEKIVISEIDRISRDLMDFLKLVEIVVNNGTELCGIKEEINIDTAIGRFLVNIKSVVAQFEREKDAERIIDNQSYRAEVNHEWCFGKTPFGWRKKEGTNLLEINEDDQKVFNEIIETIKLGYNQKETVDILNSRCIGGRIWTTSSLNRILARTMNYGLYQNKYVKVENFCPPLISKSELDEILKYVKKHKRKTKYQYYFKEKIYCTQCKKICATCSTVKKSKVYKYYYCESCKKRILEPKIYDQVTDDTAKIIASYKSKEITKYEDRIKQLSRKKEELYRMMLGNKIDLTVYSDTTKQLDNDLKIIQSNLIKCQNMPIAELSELSLKERKRVLCNGFKRIEVNLTTKKVVQSHLNL